MQINAQLDANAPSARCAGGSGGQQNEPGRYGECAVVFGRRRRAQSQSWNHDTVDGCRRGAPAPRLAPDWPFGLHSLTLRAVVPGTARAEQGADQGPPATMRLLHRGDSRVVFPEARISTKEAFY